LATHATIGLGLLLAAVVPTVQAAADPNAIEAFVREGCPHCAKAEEFLAQLQRERPALRVTIRDVQKEQRRWSGSRNGSRAACRRRARAVVRRRTTDHRLFRRSTDKLIRSAGAGEQGTGQHRGHFGSRRPVVPASVCSAFVPPPEPVEICFFGRRLTLDDGLPAFTWRWARWTASTPVRWVLLLMISLLAPLNNRRRMLAIAGTVLIQDRLLFMAACSTCSAMVCRALRSSSLRDRNFAGWSTSRTSRLQGRRLPSIPERAKPGIYSRMREISYEEPRSSARSSSRCWCRSWVLTPVSRCSPASWPCTARYRGVLQLPAALLAAYMLDDIIILTIGVVMLSRHRLQEREGRVLKLVSGLVMIGLGIWLICPPDPVLAGVAAAAVSGHGRQAHYPDPS
jgi:hypothetical protein